MCRVVVGCVRRTIHAKTRRQLKEPAALNGDWCTAVAMAIALLITQLQKVVDQSPKTTAQERKSLYHLLCDFSNIFAWEGAKHGQTKVVIHKADMGPRTPDLAIPETHTTTLIRRSATDGCGYVARQGYNAFEVPLDVTSYHCV